MSALIALASPQRIKRNRLRWRRGTSSRQHYNYFRDYEPGTGRYHTPDPIGLKGGVSLYGYVGGNPLTRIDPFGLATSCSNPANAAACAAAGIEISSTAGAGTAGAGTAGTGTAVGGAGVSWWSRFASDVRGLGSAVGAVVDAICDDDDGDHCDKKLSPELLRIAGIRGSEHGIKEDALGTNKNISRYDLCGCKDGRIVVKPWGCKGPIVAETPYRWK